MIDRGRRGDIRAPFEQVFGDASVRRERFGQLLQSALVSTVVVPSRTT